MKLCTVVCFITVMCLVRESESSEKIISAIKNIFHRTKPTVPTTTVIPTIPEFGSQHGQREEDWGSRERESSTSKSKSKQSDEDSSASHSLENQEGSFSNYNNKYNSVAHGKTKPYPGKGSQHSFQPIAHTTETSSYNSGYGEKDDKNTFSSYDSSINRGSTRTTTETYGQGNKNEINIGQSSSSGGYNNEKTKSTTPTSYGFDSHNEEDKSPQGTNDQQSTNNNYDGPYSSNTHSSDLGGTGTVSENFSSTPKNFEVSWGNSDNVGQSTSTGNSGDSKDGNNKPQSTTSRTDYTFDINNMPEQSSAFGGVSSSYGQSTPTTQFGGYQHQDYNSQSSTLGNFNSQKTRPSTPRSVDNTNSFDQADHSSSFDKSYGQNTEGTTLKNGTGNTPEQIPSYSYTDSILQTTPPTYDDTNLNGVASDVSSGSNYNAGANVLTSTTPRVPDYISASSMQGENEQQTFSGSKPSSSTTTESKDTKLSGNEDGNFVFPDDPMLNPMPQAEKTFEESVSPHATGSRDNKVSIGTHAPRDRDNSPYVNKYVPGGGDNRASVNTHAPGGRDYKPSVKTHAPGDRDNNPSVNTPAPGGRDYKPSVTTPAPVGGTDGRHIIDAPVKEKCKPGETLFNNKCEKLERK